MEYKAQGSKDDEADRMKGWYSESYRHSLASKGIRTSFKAVDVPFYDDVAMSLFSREDLGKRIGSGRDRVVFDLGKDKNEVIKIALNPSGLKQNKMELEDVGLKPIYYGRDFVVLEKAAKTMKDSSDVTDYGASSADFNKAVEEVTKIYPQCAWGDIERHSSWGFDKEGKLVILDKGALDRLSLRIQPVDIDKWNEEVAARRIELRSEGRDRILQMAKGDLRSPEGWRGRFDQWEIRPRVRRVKTDPGFLETEKEDINAILKELQERKITAGVAAIVGKEGVENERLV